MSVEMMEHDEDLWTRFVSTGSVEDYLKYRTEIRNSFDDSENLPFMREEMLTIL